MEGTCTLLGDRRSIPIRMRPCRRLRTDIRWGFGIAFCLFATVSLAQSVVQPVLSDPGTVDSKESLAQPATSPAAIAAPVIKVAEPTAATKPSPQTAIIQVIDDPAVRQPNPSLESNGKQQEPKADTVEPPANQRPPRRPSLPASPPLLKPRIESTRAPKSSTPAPIDSSAMGLPARQTYSPARKAEPAIVGPSEPVELPFANPAPLTSAEPKSIPTSEKPFETIEKQANESNAGLSDTPQSVPPTQPAADGPAKPIDALKPIIATESPNSSTSLREETPGESPIVDSSNRLAEPSSAMPQEPQGVPLQEAPINAEPSNGIQNTSIPNETQTINTEQSLPNSEAFVQGLSTETPLPYWITDGRLAIKAPLDRSATVDLDSLIWAALSHSPYIQSIQLRPQILETEINQAQGVFDPSRFASSIWNDRSDPVGNTLTTGGAPRLNEHFLDNKAGVRKKNELGGNWEAAQELGLKDNNSNFFVPRQQADTRMVLRYTQPLMKGAGRTYNRASISIAKLSFDASNHETNRALQTHIMDVIESYWELVYQRSIVLQLHRGMTRLQAIENQLTNRADLDAIRNQLLRAGSAINGLKARYARAMSQVVQSEERLRQLVNAPWIQPSSIDEIIPSSPPESALAAIQLDQELDTALMSRPDILAIRDEIKAANVRLRVAEQDLRPTLNIVTDFYVRGLNGDYDVANSFADQFASGAPSYSGGLEYLRPKNQTVANAIRRARDLEIRQLLFQLEDKLLQTGAEVRSSIATVQATHAELTSSVDATLSAQAEVEYLDARWQSGAFLEPTQISLSLEQLMDAEQRLIQAEGNWAAAQSQYMIAIAKLRYDVGNLMSVEPVDVVTEP